MSKQLTDQFCSKPNGALDFWRKYPLLVDPQTFGKLPGETKFNPLTGMQAQVQVQIGSVLKHGYVDPGKDKVISNKSVVLYAEFDYMTSLKQVASKSLVIPQLYLLNKGGYCAKMYYLPWKEDKKHTMIISDEADYFMTASMHGCRFQVNDMSGGYFEVSHTNVQPVVGKDAQAEAVKLANFNKPIGPRVVDYGKDRYIQEVEQEFARVRTHAGVYGIDPTEVISFDPGTYLVNVLGIRTGDAWEFYYQIVGKMIVALTGSTTKKKWLTLFGYKTIPIGTKTETVKHQIELDVVVKTGKLWP